MTDDERFYHLSWYVADDYKRQMFAEELHNSDELAFQSLHSTEPAIAWPSDVTFKVRGSAVEDVPFTALMWPLFSERLKTLIEDADLTGVVFYPVRVVSELAVEVPRYWYAHIRCVPDTIDMERSMYKYVDLPSAPVEKNPLMMIKFALKLGGMSPGDLFRPKESSSSAFCSGRFRHIFVENGCTGLGFDPIPVS